MDGGRDQFTKLIGTEAKKILNLFLLSEILVSVGGGYLRGLACRPLIRTFKKDRVIRKSHSLNIKSFYLSKHD